MILGPLRVTLGVSRSVTAVRGQPSLEQEKRSLLVPRPAELILPTLASTLGPMQLESHPELSLEPSRFALISITGSLKYASLGLLKITLIQAFCLASSWFQIRNTSPPSPC